MDQAEHVQEDEQGMNVPEVIVRLLPDRRMGKHEDHAHDNEQGDTGQSGYRAE